MHRHTFRPTASLAMVFLFLVSTWSPLAARTSNRFGSNTIGGIPTGTLEAIAPGGGIISMVSGGNQKANLDQSRNGPFDSPLSLVNWVNGNAGPQNAHSAEGYSIPYRLVLNNLEMGPHVVVIEWDIRVGSANAIDFLTHVNRIDNPPGTHLALFGHAPETIDPTIGVPGLGAPTTFAIPRPSSAGSTVAGQPESSFLALSSNEREFTIYNGTSGSITYVSEGDLAADKSTTRLQVDFIALASTVVLAWGGHIASQDDWGPGNSAANMKGLRYHIRLIGLDGSGGNQDRSMQTEGIARPTSLP